MWSIFKYVIDSPDTNNEEPSKTVDEITEDIRFENILQTIKDEIDKNAENYIVSLHYLEFPVLLNYGFSKLKETKHLKLLLEYLEPVKEVRKIILMGKADYIKGFYFLQNQIRIQQEILMSLDQETFDRRSAESGLEPYIINDLRTIWKNRRLDYLKQSLTKKIDIYYKPDIKHPLYQTFLKYLEETYKRGVDRFKTFICIGSTYIGKSVFFTKFLIPEDYYIYHSNYLEYSKMPNQPNKVFRILDDINWEQVTNTELKSLMNRNISSVNIKYGYEYIFPLISIIIMNAEDYKIFRKHFSDVWEFVEKNTVVYPEQIGQEPIEETRPLFTDIKTEIKDEDYLFNKIVPIEKLKECKVNNMNEYIKEILNNTESWKYDTQRYIQIPDKRSIKIPNPEINKKTILNQYEEYILKKKQREMNGQDEKKPMIPWYRRYKEEEPEIKKKYVENSNKKRFESLEEIDDEDDEETYNEEDDDDTEMSDDDNFEDIDDDDTENGKGFEEYKKGFIQI